MDLLSVLCFFFVFFSSRRRHTRYIGDWSSDVCSPDLSSFTIFFSSCNVHEFMRIVALIVHLVLVIVGACGSVGCTCRIGNAVSPVLCSDGPAGHGLANLNQLLVGPCSPCLRVMNDREEAVAFHGFRYGNTCSIEQRGRKVDDDDDFLDLARALKAGPVDQHRNAKRAVVRTALVLLITSAEVTAVVAHKDEDCVVGQALLFENLAKPAN